MASALAAAAGDVGKARSRPMRKLQMRTSRRMPRRSRRRTRAFYQLLTRPRGPFWSAARTDDANLDAADARAARDEARARRKSLRDVVSKPIPVAQAIQEGGTPKSLFPGIQDVPVHIRGRYDRLGDVVPRRFPQVIAGVDQKPIKNGSGRLELAKWLASPEHPLTARVMVNRIWQHHFGEGIVAHAEQFRKARHAADASGTARSPRASSSCAPAGRSRRCTGR